MRIIFLVKCCETIALNNDEYISIISISFSYLVDTIAPRILYCSNDITAQADPGRYGATVSWNEPEVLDASSDVMLLVQTHVSGTFFAIGTTVVSYIFRDNANNIGKCSFSITVAEGNYRLTLKKSRTKKYFLYLDIIFTI